MPIFKGRRVTHILTQEDEQLFRYIPSTIPSAGVFRKKEKKSLIMPQVSHVSCPQLEGKSPGGVQESDLPQTPHKSFPKSPFPVTPLQSKPRHVSEAIRRRLREGPAALELPIRFPISRKT